MNERITTDRVSADYLREALTSDAYKTRLMTAANWTQRAQSKEDAIQTGFMIYRDPSSEGREYSRVLLGTPQGVILDDEPWTEEEFRAAYDARGFCYNDDMRELRTRSELIGEIIEKRKLVRDQLLLAMTVVCGNDVLLETMEEKSYPVISTVVTPEREPVLIPRDLSVLNGHREDNSEISEVVTRPIHLLFANTGPRELVYMAIQEEGHLSWDDMNGISQELRGEMGADAVMLRDHGYNVNLGFYYSGEGFKKLDWTEKFAD